MCWKGRRGRGDGRTTRDTRDRGFVYFFWEVKRRIGFIEICRSVAVSLSYVVRLTQLSLKHD